MNDQPTESEALGVFRIQYIGNMSFHITDGRTTLLTDFPYRSGAFGYMKYDLKSITPIVDGLSLISHSHSDHWNRRRFKALDHAIIAPPRILKRLHGRKTIPFGELMRYKDIEVEAFKTPHRYSPEHHSYLITWHDVRFYFPGDAESPKHILDARGIDVMFITPPILRILHRLGRSVDAKRLIACHYRKREGEELPEYQDCLRMAQGEILEVPFNA